ncbi:MAG: hypothetical protein ACOVQA_12015, partial [Thermoflexibacteraceae bacterium]
MEQEKLPPELLLFVISLEVIKVVNKYRVLSEEGEVEAIIYCYALLNVLIDEIDPDTLLPHLEKS